MLYICFFIYNSIQKAISDEEIALIAYVVFFVLTITIVFVAFFLTFQKRKNALLLKNIEQQKQFDEELLITQQEIQEETLKSVGRELHDNVGQLLAFATMQMNSVSRNATQDLKPKIDTASDALKDSLTEVRALSKSLNSDVIQNLGFKATVKNEIERLNKSGLIKATLSTEGISQDLDNKKDGIILFRILQEFFSNTLKYAEAENLEVLLDYNEKELLVRVKDDGIGFNLENAEQGSGMTNMKKRAELLNAKFNLESEPKTGTTLTLNYPYR